MQLSKTLVLVAVIGCGGGGKNPAVAPHDVSSEVANGAKGTDLDAGLACGSIVLADGVTVDATSEAVALGDRAVCLVRGSDSSGNVVGVVALMQASEQSWATLDTMDFEYDVAEDDRENETDVKNGDIEISTLAISPSEDALLVKITTTLDRGYNLEKKFNTVMYRVVDSKFVDVLSFKESEFIEVATESVTRDLTATNKLTRGFYDLDIVVSEMSDHSESEQGDLAANEYVEHYVWNGTKYKK